MSVRTVAGTVLVGALILGAAVTFGSKTEVEKEPPSTIDVKGTGGHKVKITVKGKKMGDSGMPGHWIIGPQEADVIVKVPILTIKGLARTGDTVVFSGKPVRTAPKGITISCSIEVDDGERDYDSMGGQDAIDDGILCSAVV